MLGSHPISAVLGADISADADTAVFKSYLKGLTEVGLHVLFCKPGTKEPDDLRTAAQITEDDTFYDLEVNDGKGGAKHPGGVHLATDNLDRLRKYVARYRKVYGDGSTGKSGNVKPIVPITMAVSIGPSNLVVVDCDTEAQRNAFGDWMAEKSGDSSLRLTTPTVLSPGVQRDGVWVHKDGGHFYFAVEDVKLPALPGKMTVEHNGESFDIFWNNRYVLIPPSQRSEGKYERIGPVLSLSKHLWLAAEIDTFTQARLAPKDPSTHSPMAVEAREALQEWYECTPWYSLLQPEGWEFAGYEMTCGCEVWNRPGWSNPKSAVAHVIGCRGRFSDSNDPPIHFFTSTPGRSIEKKLAEVNGIGHTLSKLQLYSALLFNGDDGMALRSIPDIPSNRGGVIFEEGVPWGMSLGAGGLMDGLNTEYESARYVHPITPPLYGNQPVTGSATSGDTDIPAAHTSEGRANTTLSSSGNLASTAGFQAFQKMDSFPVHATEYATEHTTDSTTAPATDSATVKSTNTTDYATENTGNQTSGDPWASDDRQEIRETVKEVVNETLAALMPEMIRLIKEEIHKPN